MSRKGISRRAVRKHKKKRHVSSIEKLVAAWLTIDKIPFRTEVKAGRCHVDVVVKAPDDHKIAVELNGCYWHGCCKCFPNMSNEMQMKRFKDIKRYQFLRKKGYQVVILWECFILDQPDDARQKLRDLVGLET